MSKSIFIKSLELLLQICHLCVCRLKLKLFKVAEKNDWRFYKQSEAGRRCKLERLWHKSLWILALTNYQDTKYNLFFCTTFCRTVSTTWQKFMLQGKVVWKDNRREREILIAYKIPFCQDMDTNLVRDQLPLKDIVRLVMFMDIVVSILFPRNQ